jgi:ABC-type transport system involved in multi-copper enzyme maturation permease subunit
MSRIWTIARREIKALFDQPTGYVLLVVFLAINAFMFFRNVYISNVATLRPMLDFMPWIFLFFVPAVAMRSLAEDNRGGMLEIVLSQPLSGRSWFWASIWGFCLPCQALWPRRCSFPWGWNSVATCSGGR